MSSAASHPLPDGHWTIVYDRDGVATFAVLVDDGLLVLRPPWPQDGQHVDASCWQCLWQPDAPSLSAASDPGFAGRAHVRPVTHREALAALPPHLRRQACDMLAATWSIAIRDAGSQRDLLCDGAALTLCAAGARVLQAMHAIADEDEVTADALIDIDLSDGRQFDLAWLPHDPDTMRWRGVLRDGRRSPPPLTANDAGRLIGFEVAHPRYGRLDMRVPDGDDWSWLVHGSELFAGDLRCAWRKDHAMPAWVLTAAVPYEMADEMVYAQLRCLDAALHAVHEVVAEDGEGAQDSLVVLADVHHVARALHDMVTVLVARRAGQQIVRPDAYAARAGRQGTAGRHRVDLQALRLIALLERRAMLEETRDTEPAVFFAELLSLVGVLSRADREIPGLGRDTGVEGLMEWQRLCGPVRAHALAVEAALLLGIALDARHDITETVRSVEDAAHRVLWLAEQHEYRPPRFWAMVETLAGLGLLCELSLQREQSDGAAPPVDDPDGLTWRQALVEVAGAALAFAALLNEDEGVCGALHARFSMRVTDGNGER